MCSETSEAVGIIWEHAQKEFQKFLKIRITLMGSGEAGSRLGQIGILGFFSESEIVVQEGDSGDGGVKTTSASCSPQAGSCGRSSTLLQG